MQDSPRATPPGRLMWSRQLLRELACRTFLSSERARSDPLLGSEAPCLSTVRLHPADTDPVVSSHGHSSPIRMGGLKIARPKPRGDASPPQKRTGSNVWDTSVQGSLARLPAPCGFFVSRASNHREKPGSRQQSRATWSVRSAMSRPARPSPRATAPLAGSPVVGDRRSGRKRRLRPPKQDPLNCVVQRAGRMLRFATSAHEGERR